MSSSDSDDEDLSQFQEAIDVQFITNNMYRGNTEGEAIDVIKSQATLPSLRRNKIEEDDSYNFFKVSPQFQDYVSRELSKKLEKYLSGILTYSDSEAVKQSKPKGGIKLLKSSEKFLKLNKNEKDNIRCLKRPIVKLKKDDCLEMNCKTVAVSGEDILIKKDIKHWSKRSKAPVFNYKYSGGSLIYQEPPFR